MNLRSLECFLVVTEEMSFTRAAERLFVTQQTLSDHIKRLEAEYDAVLFHRKPVLSLTQKGEELRYWAARILAEEKNLRANLYDIGTNCRGHIRIGIARLRANRMMPEIMERYGDLYPNVSIKVTDGTSDTFQEALQTNRLDMYIGSNVRPRAREIDLHLVSEAIWACVRRDLLERHLVDAGRTLASFLKNGPDLQAIPKMPLLVHQTSNRSRQDLDKYFYDAGIRPNIYFECNSQPLLFDLAQRGKGMAFLSPIVLYSSWKENDGQLPDLCVFSLGRVLPERVLSLIYRDDVPLPQYAQAFIRITQEVFAEYVRLLDFEEQYYGRKS